MTPEEEDALYAELRALPDFECMPLPARWFKKYNIPPVKATNTKEFIDSNYTMKCSIAPKDLPPIFINEPQQNGKLVAIHPPEDIKVETISRPYVSNDGAVLPFLLETEEKERDTVCPPSELACTCSQ